jgi:hypothetical protein
MPCTDPRDVTCLGDAFDLTTPEVLQWELELIWKAIDSAQIVLSEHAQRAATDDAIPRDAVWRVIRDGIRRSKDLDPAGHRKIGINFEGKVRGGRWIRLKVSWWRRYIVATVHAL